ncbi:hypothetical protein BXZ70DRAFT_1009027 [Cristinia sonorae]|uniref:DUF6534 domain-containing protein n=1 Tax=Cristinia sonorae TaxID=1940300 RepID=A0A8K0XNX4_9AGAR|nr:hypothetical protein BXZ70DRAFT_1009027 [Cristinia sonorae]
MTKYGDTLGAILIGGFVALFLSGIVFMQTMIYYRVYGKDPIRLKLIVSVVWLLDMIHSAFTISVDWYYLVSDREDDSYLRVYWPVPACIASTSVVTSVVMSFYIHRVWTLSGHKAYLAVPMMILNLFRVAAGFASAAEVARKTYLYEFTMSVDWPFVATLATSSFLDFLVATILVILLRRSRTGLFNMDQVLDSITLYTVENGLLTAVTTIVSLVCWVTMPYNLIFLGIHFTIAKLYANAFLATLNARKILQERTRHVGITATDVAPGSDGIRFSQYNSHLRKPSDATDHSDESTRLNSLKNAVVSPTDPAMNSFTPNLTKYFLLVSSKSIFAGASTAIVVQTPTVPKQNQVPQPPLSHLRDKRVCDKSRFRQLRCLQVLCGQVRRMGRVISMSRRCFLPMLGAGSDDVFSWV